MFVERLLTKAAVAALHIALTINLHLARKRSAARPAGIGGSISSRP
jgi:hypothetical protein